MAFATSFLPTPGYWQAFKSFLQLQYICKSSEIIKQHLDAMEMARFEMSKERFSDEEQEIWTRNAMGFPGWGELYSSPKSLLDAIESWMNEMEEAE